MVRIRRSFEDPDQASQRQTASLAALALTMALVVAGLYLVDVLRVVALQQDCTLVVCRTDR